MQRLIEILTRPYRYTADHINECGIESWEQYTVWGLRHYTAERVYCPHLLGQVPNCGDCCPHRPHPYR